MDMTAHNKYAPIPGTIPGTLVNLSGVQLVLAPLNLDQVRDFESLITDIGKVDGKTVQQMMEHGLPLILASLQRNYPDMCLEDLRELIDLGNFQAATEAVIKISGYATTPGELQTSLSTGTTSTPA